MMVGDIQTAGYQFCIHPNTIRVKKLPDDERRRSMGRQRELHTYGCGRPIFADETAKDQ